MKTFPWCRKVNVVVVGSKVEMAEGVLDIVMRKAPPMVGLSRLVLIRHLERIRGQTSHTRALGIVHVATEI